MDIFTTFYFLFLSSVFLAWAVGAGLLRLLKNWIEIKGYYQRIFISIALGIFTIVIISSVTVTGFKTISTGFLLTGSFILYELFRFKSVNSKPFCLSVHETNTGIQPGIFFICEGIFITLFFFSWQAYTILKSGDFSFAAPHPDWVYYADIAEVMWQTGQENTYRAGNLISESYYGMTPYHYFELWLCAFFSRMYTIENFFSAQLLVKPLFYLMMALGLFSVSEIYYRLNHSKKAIALLLLFMGGMPFIIDHSVENFHWITLIESPLFEEKIAHYFWISLMAFLFILSNFFTAGLLVFLSLIFTSSTTLPGILPGTALFILVSWVFRLQNKKEALKQAGYSAALALIFYALYQAHGNMNFNFWLDKPWLYYTDMSPLLQQAIRLFYLKVTAVELILRVYKIPLIFLLLLSPFLMTVLLSAWKKIIVLENLKLPLLYALSVYFSSLVCYGTLYKMWDSWQFVENNNYLPLAFLCIAVLIFLHYRRGLAGKLSLYLLLVALLFKAGIYWYNRNHLKEIRTKRYSDRYLREISEVNGGNKMGICLRLPPGEERVTGRNHVLDLRMGGYTAFFSQFSLATDVSLTEMTNWDKGRWGEMEKAMVKAMPFYQYVKQQKEDKKFISYDHSRLDFIHEFDIGYMVVAKGYEVSPLLLKKVKRAITDPVSGERFMVLQ